MNIFQQYRNHNVDVRLTAALLTKDNAQKLAEWCGGHVIDEIDAVDSTKHYAGINFLGSNGEWQRVSEGQYLAMGEHGFDKWNAGIFQSSFVEI